METNFTKGRWEVKKSESKDAYNVVGTVLGGRYKIARCPWISIDNETAKAYNEREEKEAEANAKIIAAAPDMFDALKCLLEGGTIPHGWKRDMALAALSKVIS